MDKFSQSRDEVVKWKVDNVIKYYRQKSRYGDKFYLARIIWVGNHEFTSESPRHSMRRFDTATEAVNYGLRWCERLNRAIIYEGEYV